MPDAVSLRQQLACATRELALRVPRTHGYPRLLANETMLQSTAVRELQAMQATVATLRRLVASGFFHPRCGLGGVPAYCRRQA